MKRFDIRHLDLPSFKEMMERDKPTIVKFFNPTCHLCNGLNPIFEQLCQQYGESFDFAKLNVAKHPRVAKVFKIEGVPELFIIKKDFVQQIPYPDDETASEKSGYSKDYLIQHIERIKELLSEMEG
jgi:thiol-disulfide isomerase/thioredoxin